MPPASTWVSSKWLHPLLPEAVSGSAQFASKHLAFVQSTAHRGPEKQQGQNGKAEINILQGSNKHWITKARYHSHVQGGSSQSEVASLNLKLSGRHCSPQTALAQTLLSPGTILSPHHSGFLETKAAMFTEPTCTSADDAQESSPSLASPPQTATPFCPREGTRH